MECKTAGNDKVSQYLIARSIRFHESDRTALLNKVYNAMDNSERQCSVELVMEYCCPLWILVDKIAERSRLIKFWRLTAIMELKS